MKTLENESLYRQETELLDFKDELIQTLIQERAWNNLPKKERINQVYLYVRDEIIFGYNDKDEITASQVIKDGLGQCNTKAILLMALLRGVGVSCRFHGFTIDKALQKGAFSKFWYRLVPNDVIHSWVEILYNKQWYNLEGVILDKLYLNKLQQKFKNKPSDFCGYGVYTEDFMNPIIDWNENDTYIQNLGINNDFGVFDSPDDFFINHHQNISFVKKLLFKLIVKNSNNKIVELIRSS